MDVVAVEFTVLNISIRQIGKNISKEYEEFWDEKYNKAFQGVAVEFTTKIY